MLITSNRSVGEWGTVLGDPVVATAILDHLLHHGQAGLRPLNSPRTAARWAGPTSPQASLHAQNIGQHPGEGGAGRGGGVLEPRMGIERGHEIHVEHGQQ